jgi:hypothetical protein
MACINAAFLSSHQFHIFAKFDVHGRPCRLPVRTFVCGIQCATCARGSLPPHNLENVFAKEEELAVIYSFS